MTERWDADAPKVIIINTMFSTREDVDDFIALLRRFDGFLPPKAKAESAPLTATDREGEN